MIRLREFYREEHIRLEPDRLTHLCREMGAFGADDLLCRAVEELALRLERCERLWRAGDCTELRRCARSTIGIAEQIGMVSLARVARDVVDCADRRDPAALGATVARLARIGERSLSAVWDSPGLPG
ncbi:hypothetical protein [Pontibaca methylaminivorans]|uniref:Hpt domain-containing protein n=1 Tax=Pontibaca methylaminivorans TaxID=515897 RepID=A0A1R3X2R4_9RHOB|nr:hypothetical protein [Pontibaca methylaminivorans]SIT83607.1 hypothetical protein SAMN05421849_1941 [Pontibaca methylaminivorans]